MAVAVQRIKLACGICDADSDGVHFGAESCAACAAFFRRSVALGKKYSCRREGACLTNKSLRCNCRACRFKKCVQNGMDSTLVQLARDDNRTKLKQPQPLEQPDAAEKIDMPISSISPSKAAQKSELINKMLLAYKQLLHNRTVTYCSNSLMSMLINDDDSMEQPVLRPAEISNHARFHRTEITFAMEYAKSMDPFLQLPPDQKLEFFKAFSCIWGGIEGSFRTVKAGGFEKRWLVMPDNSYVVLDDLQGYYEGDVLKVDKQTAARLFKPAGEQALAEIMLPMVQNKMNDVEFVTLAAITSWTCDPKLSNCSEETKTLGKITRDQLCADLYAYYANTGIPDPDVRFGNLLLMIPALLEYARTSLENFRLVKFFDMMNYDKVLDDLYN